MSKDFREDDRQFIAQAKRVLDQSLGELDVTATRRLQQARSSALHRRPTARRWIGWVGSAALASIAVLALVLWRQPPAAEHQVAVPLEDVELVMSVENVELAQDLDFYRWLANDETTG